MVMLKFSLLITVFPFCFLCIWYIFIYKKGVGKSIEVIFTFLTGTDSSNGINKYHWKQKPQKFFKPIFWIIISSL